MNDWKLRKLNEFIIFNPKESIKKGTLAKKIGMEKIEPYNKYLNDFEYVEFKGGSKFKNGDTLLARITPCLENGKTAKVTILDNNEIGFGSTEFIVLRKIEEISDEDFIYYLSISPTLREIAIKSMIGTSGRQRVQQNVLENFKINLPPLQEQKAIAKTLSCLDEKIELNNKINKNLEEMAQAIFKKWFIDFDYPLTEEEIANGGREFVDSELGKIPKGWKVVELGDFFPVITGKKNANIANKSGKYPFFSCSQNILYCNDFSFDANAILLAGNGDFNVKVYKGKFEAYQRTYVLVPKNDKFIGFLYFLIKNKLNEITKGYRGSVIKFITKSNIENFKINIPNNIQNMGILENFNKNLEFMYINNLENEKLKQIRDTLLPKLINGDVRVPF